MSLAVSDQGPDGGGGQHHLEGRHPSLTIGSGEQALRNDAQQRSRQLQANLSLLMRREDVHDPIHRLADVVGVEGGEHQMARFGRGQDRRDGLQITHLSHHDHVGVLAQDVFEGG